MDVIVGTAGHIDHGKTALVKALTGVDADRLPEEKHRGITIDIGFAEMHAGDTRFGFVDVPGHERFVKNMLAGASGIDMVLLVIAADEGVMPQTREHFDICRLLRIKTGVIALTKTDLADADTLEFAKLDAAELVKNSFLEGGAVFEVSSRTATGISELRDGLAVAAENVARESNIHEARLPIDRSFSIKGFGAVVTGTLTSGEIVEGDELELLPRGKRVRVRGIQTHGKTVDSAHTGQRTAVNLAGVSNDEITRGMVLAAPGALTVTQSCDAEIEVLGDAPTPIRSRQRVRIHAGTAEVLGRVTVLNEAQRIEPGSTGFVQLRLESPVAAAHADRFIIRSYSPQRTIAGGRILDPAAPRHRRADLETVTATLAQLSEASDGSSNLVEIITRMAGSNGIRTAHVRSRTGLRQTELATLIDEGVRADKIVAADGVLVSRASFDQLCAATLAAVAAHHRGDKLARGMLRETLREKIFKHSEPELFRSVTSSLERDGKLVFDQEVFKLASYETKLSMAEADAQARLRKTFSAAGLEVPKLDDALNDASALSGLDAKSTRKVFQLLVNNGELAAVTPEFYFSSEALAELTTRLREFARTSGNPTIDVSKFKEIAGVSRKYAIPLLEYFDRTRVTRRVGDKRQVM